MALVVEDGTGLSTAESYISVADAVTYLDNRAGSSNLFSAEGTTANQEAALRVATEWLDNRYRLRWKGRRGELAQALAWPRQGVYDPDGYAVSTTAVPTVVANATAELALRYLENSTGHGTSRLEPDITSPGAIKRKREKVDVIEEETEYAGGGSQLTAYTRVERMLAGVIRPAGEPIIA